MTDIIHKNYLLLPILNRFDIQLGFGDKTVDEVCKLHKVNADFFLEIINSFNDQDYFPQAHLQTFPLQLIINYIKKSHRYYLELKIPQIESIIHEISRTSDNDHKKSFELIEKFFKEYKEELITHIQNEDNTVYPYVLTIDNALTTNQISKEHVDMVNKNSISIFAEEHNNVEDKLFDLKNIIIKYLPPCKDYTLSNSLLFELFRLERDLNDHARIEDKVLVPKVQFIEQEILQRS